MVYTMKIAIHQPNFFPWYPFFQKMMRCDIFVILSNCQFEKNNYQNRFKMQGRYRQWNTLSVANKIENIKDKLYLNPMNDFELIKNNLPDYKEILEQFQHIINSDNSQLLLFVNYSIIKKIKALLKIDTEIGYDFLTSKTATERLVELCKFYKCDTYLSGIGAVKYINMEVFKYHGITVEFQDINEIIRKPILEVLKCIE